MSSIEAGRFVFIVCGYVMCQQNYPKNDGSRQSQFIPAIDIRLLLFEVFQNIRLFFLED